MARSATLFVGVALLFTVGGCEKLIGIEDTVVVEAGSAGTSQSDHAGASKAGESSAGAAQGGKLETAGSANGGKGGKAGSANGGNGGDATGGASAGNGGGAPACDCKPPTPVCENGVCIARGPTQIKAGPSASAFYIDSTEVTNEQYAAFLTAKGSDTSGQRPECDWNKSYQPADALGDDKRPAVNVDFCDAAAFCDWAGERLCGDLSGAPLAITALSEPTKSQWYLACAGPDSERYPYGGFDFKADYCNVYFSGNMADVGKFNQCEGHYSGVFDLVGNAAEWVDACIDDPSGDHALDTCTLLGGSYLQETYRCDTHFNEPRNHSDESMGFRCCSK
jgi:hypothetical protein